MAQNTVDRLSWKTGTPRARWQEAEAHSEQSAPLMGRLKNQTTKTPGPTHQVEYREDPDDATKGRYEEAAVACGDHVELCP